MIARSRKRKDVSGILLHRWHPLPDDRHAWPASLHAQESQMIVALAGGVGGAKLADGLNAELPEGELTVVVNSADDFELHGLHISPDLDTVMYTLAGLANPEAG